MEWWPEHCCIRFLYAPPQLSWIYKDRANQDYIKGQVSGPIQPKYGCSVKFTFLRQALSDENITLYKNTKAT